MKELSIFIFTISLLFLGQSAFANEEEAFAKAETLSQQGAYLEANTLLDEFIQNNSARLYDMASAWFLKSYNYMQLGDYADALYANERSKKLRTRLHSDEIAQNYMREGSIHLLRGDYEYALNVLYAAADMPIENPEIYALVYAYIASAQQELGNYAKAQEQLQQSLDIIEIEMGEEHPDFAIGNYNLGRLLTKMGKTAAAEMAFNRAFEVAGNLENGKSIQAKILNAKGVLFQESYPLKALSFYKMGLKIIETQAIAYQPEAARIHLNIARLKLQGENIDSTALFHANRVLKMMQVDSTENQAGFVFENQLFAEALALKALYFLQQTNSNTANQEAALYYSSQAIDYLNLHLNLLSSDAARFALLEEESFIFETAIHAAMRRYETTEDVDFAYKAFRISEEAKSIVLRANRMRDVSLAIFKKPLWEKEKALKTAIREAEAQVVFHPRDKHLHKILAEKRKDFNIFMAALSPFQNEYALYRFNRSVPKVVDLQKGLNDETGILSYFVGENNYYLFCITQERFHALELPLNFTGNQLQKNVRKWIQFGQMKGKTNTGIYTKINDVDKVLPDLNETIASCLQAIKKVDKRKFSASAFSLYTRLIAPVAKTLKGIDALVIIPDGALFGLPFEALLTEKVKTVKKIRFKKLDYLIDDYEISYTYSVSFLQETRKTDSVDVSASFLGFAPTFSLEENTRILSDNSYRFDTTWQSDQNLRTCLQDDFSENKKFKPLPYSEKEITAIANLFSTKKIPAEGLFHRRANEESFKLNAGNFEYLHLATHSFVNNKNPLLSGIAFAQVPMKGEGNQSEQSDGILYAAEILALPIAAKLVVLSSCESSVGPNFTGDGPFSLSRVFIEAGAEEVMASLWKVYDKHTLPLMVSFYNQLLDGKSTATALRKAKRKMIKKSPTANPKIWAGFVLNR